IKTKLVEALACDVSCVSTRSGAFGVNDDITGNKLSIVSGNDWEEFVKKITETNTAEIIPPTFYYHFYWGNIADKVLKILSRDT
ncbi:MAG: glycosyl transferase group 1, partial [Ferruginibacter sp.]